MSAASGPLWTCRVGPPVDLTLKKTEQGISIILEATHYEFYGAAVAIDEPFEVGTTRYSRAFEFFCADRNRANVLAHHFNPLQAIGEIKCGGLDCAVVVDIIRHAGLETESTTTRGQSRFVVPTKIVDGVNYSRESVVTQVIKSEFGIDSTLICHWGNQDVLDVVFYLPDESVSKGAICRCDITSYKVVYDHDGERTDRFSP